MLRSARTRSSALNVRRCLSCGYAGRLAQVEIPVAGAATERDEGATSAAAAGAVADWPDDAGDHLCPRCLCDFRVRPPRSYAEMEGFTANDLGVAARHAVGTAHAADAHLRRRWLAFLCGAVVLLTVVVSLVVAMARQLGT